MALTLIATPGLSTSNAYCTVAEADDFLLSNIYATGWADADTTEAKVPALIMATRLLDEQVEWPGYVDSLSQALLWPRQDVLNRNGRLYLDHLTIPTFLKQATAELARNILLEDRTSERSYGLASVKADVVDVVFDKRDVKPILPPSVISLVQSYGTVKGTGSGSVKLVRT